MKIRSGFVSNSSSSSFVCDVCNHDISGWDMCLEDSDMFECKAGHTVCDGHFVGKIIRYNDFKNIEEKRMYLLRLTDYEEIKNRITKTENENELDEIYEDDLKYYEKESTPVENCPCCTLKDITDSQIVEFLLYDNKTTRAKVKKSMKKQFKNYGEILAKLEKGKKK